MRKLFNAVKKVLCVAFLALMVSPMTADPVEGNGNIVKHSFDVTAFDEITMSLSATVLFTVSNEYSCTVSIDENLLEFLSFRVDEDELILGTTKRGQELSWNPTEFVVEVSAPSLEEIKLTGSGNVEVLNSLRADELEVKVSGSGNVSVGSGSIRKMKVNISGSGSVEAYCDISVLDAKISGSGNFTANVGTNLFYNISGSGNIYYYGAPSLKGKKAGSGSLEQLED